MTNQPHGESDELNSASAPSRPEWELPHGISAVIAIASLLLGAFGLSVAQGSSDPLIPSIVWWSLIILPLFLLLIWVFLRLKEEYAVLRHRYTRFSPIAAANDELAEKNESLKQDIQELNLSITALSRSQQIIVLDYSIIDAFDRTDGIHVTLNDDVLPKLTPGSVLKVLSLEDGMPLGILEVTEERTGSRRCVARFLDWNGLFLTGIRDAAQKREPVRTNSIARFTSYATEPETDVSDPDHTG